MKSFVLVLIAAVLAAVLLVFLLVGGWSTTHSEPLARPQPVMEAAPATSPTRTAPPAPASVPAGRSAESSPQTAEAFAAALDGQDLDEPVTIKKPKAPSGPDAILEPDKFREKLQTEGDPLLPAIEQLLGARGLPTTPAAASAAWEVARKWAIYRQAEETTRVEEGTARQELNEARKKILLDQPREALSRILGGKVEAGLWTDLERLGLKHQPPPRPLRAPRGASRPEGDPEGQEATADR